MKETNLYDGVRKYFEDQGFLVRGEVRDIDVCALKGEILIGIELKKNLSVALLIQGVNRQKLCDLVYIAVPKPKLIRKNRSFNNLLHLLKRLELGLLYVDVEKEEAIEVIEPTFFNLDKARKAMLAKRKALLKEIESRSLNLNQGGSTQRRLMTAYREEALKAVALLRKQGNAAPRDLKQLGLKSSIFRDNYYGWFKNLARGSYGLDETKAHDYEIYEEHIQKFYEELPS